MRSAITLTSCFALLAHAWPRSDPSKSYYAPQAGSTWHWQLQENPTTATIDLTLPVDAYDISYTGAASAAYIQKLKARGVAIICYMSIGSVENFTTDASLFDKSIVGNVYKGFTSENWLDISRYEVFAPVMKARFQAAKDAGCDAIEGDNLGVPPEESGFLSITDASVIAYGTWLAQTAHELGMAMGQKNAPTLAASLYQVFDFAVSESCQFGYVCDSYLPYIKANKAVFACEYVLPVSEVCDQVSSLNMDTILLPVLLDGTWRYSCSSKAPQNANDVQYQANADWYKNAGLDIGERPQPRSYTSPALPAASSRRRGQIKVKNLLK